MTDLRWTPSLVEERLAEAADTLRRLPEAKIQGHASTWPPYIQECWSTEGVILRRPPPSAAAITRMDEALPWLRLLDPTDARIVWLRANGEPWKVVCWRGKCMTPGLWEQMHGARLRFIYRRGAPSLLVAENMRARTGKRGGFAKGSASALRTGRGMTSVVMFILVPQVSLRKRLDVNAAAERWASALPELIVRNWRN